MLGFREQGFQVNKLAALADGSHLAFIKGQRKRAWLTVHCRVDDAAKGQWVDCKRRGGDGNGRLAAVMLVNTGGWCLKLRSLVDEKNKRSSRYNNRIANQQPPCIRRFRLGARLHLIQRGC